MSMSERMIDEVVENFFCCPDSIRRRSKIESSIGSEKLIGFARQCITYCEWQQNERIAT